MKIVYLINHKGETGLNNVVLDLTTLFSSHGHNCTIFYLKDTEKEIEFPCKTIKIDEEHPLVFKDYDIVHTHGIHPNLYVLRHKPWGKSKTKFVATLHCYVFQDFMDLFGVNVTKRIILIGLGIAFVIGGFFQDFVNTIVSDNASDLGITTYTQGGRKKNKNRIPSY